MKRHILVSSLLVFLMSCSVDNSNNRIYFEDRSDILEVDKQLGGETYIYPLNTDMEIAEDEYIKVAPDDVLDLVWTADEKLPIAFFVLKSEVIESDNRLNTKNYHVYDYSNSKDFRSKYFNKDENDTNKIVLKEPYKRQMIYLENYDL